MRVLVACEFSGIVRDAFIARGHDAWSCDLLATEKPGNHFQGDVMDVINLGWDLMIAHPPCTHLACSGAKHFYKKQVVQEEALWFFNHLLNYAPISKICVENPVGVASTKIRPPDQIIQPYHFGDSFQKTTCLWLKGLPKLVPSCMDAPLFGMKLNKGEFVTTPSGKKLPKWYSDNKSAKNRSRTFPGIANAMAEQWG